MDTSNTMTPLLEGGAQAVQEASELLDAQGIAHEVKIAKDNDPNS